MSIIAVTGANLGLGYHCCKMLAKETSVAKVIVICRSQEKCDTAVASLVKETGKPTEFYGSAVVDLADLASIKACIESFPEFDRICLNAGGVAPVVINKVSERNLFVYYTHHS